MTVIEDMPEADYRAMPGLSGTGVATLLASPARWRWEQGHPRPSTSAMGLGTLVHALTLGTEPRAIVSEYPDMRTKAAREWKAEAEAEGLRVVTADEWTRAEDIRDAVRSHATAAALLDADGVSEVSITGEHEGAPLKGRIDRLAANGLVIDLKTARDATPDAMSRALGDYGYALQLRHYADLIGSPHRAVVIAVESEPPHLVAVYRVDAATWDLAGRAVAEAWTRYADCLAVDAWPDGMPDGIADLGLKAWAFDSLDRLITTGMESRA